MDFKQLEAFIYVVKLNSFSKAAEAIFLSQPTISTHINALEKELGTKLLIRSTKVIHPTKAGTIMFEYANNLLALRDKAIESVNKLSNESEGLVEILASSVPAQYILPQVITEFNKLYPKITFKVLQSDSAHVVRDTALQKCDFGIAGSIVTTSKCVFKAFTEDKMVLIVPNIDEYKNLDYNTNLREILYTYPFIIREAGSGTRIQYEEFFADIKVDTRKINTVACFFNTQSIVHGVSKGLGISIVSTYAVESYIKTGLILPIAINNPHLNRKFYFVLKNDIILSPISKLFLNFIKEYFLCDLNK